MRPGQIPSPTPPFQLRCPLTPPKGLMPSTHYGSAPSIQRRSPSAPIPVSPPPSSHNSHPLVVKHFRINRGLHGGAIAGACDGLRIDQLFEFGEVGV